MEIQLSQKNFEALSEKVHNIVKTQNWWQRHGMEFVYLLLRILLFASGFLIFAQTGILFKIFGIIIISYAYYGIGITGTHETRHNAFVESRFWNKAWAAMPLSSVTLNITSFQNFRIACLRRFVRSSCST
ncbi:MAG: hypothetical protein A3B74_05180 [Candidatus Kerfeldbacteria bacterium RIFCSPHIGHO2_02_FULL_42_14]|uniref:Fatty acid desaturase domain-containing protein n=1 Tax=Candidatus Kerfeldbacteria bacterium RIFCSPHIGHO2_02_FULL_42_14 TaxID=1798540 RepID=A0A1G2AU42_9BACT|nr:MAG: hypothetical protein A3B74_05180 [Candidatus Kerfeldbacteria bacterium RIFCSPHIGHO2_02_FULL_42_14]OGY81611.1 MAG: hypothetical protein A3E60_02070 [Candidatus Kerfeldbacteria bacterium RIFCSPHIGHO2_12_FULL_42_13]OGY83213.1 MAG: hypothetical protein A3I91_03475 [Candidatus Kerfeldbacteria bacterium RIFCSPLOWO2_02_FULL_42_19]OGY85518.1 MAG: hypothetical protein A3G01_01465 [Candidatus Kerfeldbacteria bacterium RIFCSPLOWO2_12_FULL_43_9]